MSYFNNNNVIFDIDIVELLFRFLNIEIYFNKLK
jgi:hypothetical protein